MTSSARRLDWRPEFSLLQQFFEGKGGVVHVHVPSGDASPAHIFSKVLRSEIKSNKWAHDWSVVVINQGDPATHYLSDMIRQCLRSFNILPLPVVAASNVAIGCDNEADGNITVSNVDVSISPDSYSLAGRDDAHIDHLRAGLVELLKTRRAAIIFLNSHECDGRDLSALAQRLWDHALSDLIDVGLLVFDIYDPGKMAGKSPIWPPDASLTIELELYFSGAARVHAVEDIAAIAMSEGIHELPAPAEVFAETVMVTSRDIADTYARLGLAVSRVGAANAAKA